MLKKILQRNNLFLNQARFFGPKSKTVTKPAAAPKSTKSSKSKATTSSSSQSAPKPAA